MSYVAPSSPLSIGGVLDDGLRLFRASLGQCWKLAAPAPVTVGILIFLIKPRPPTHAMTAWQQRMHSWDMLRGPQGPLAAVLMILIELAVAATVFSAQVAVIRGESLSLADALTTGLRRVPRLLWGFVLLMLAMIGGCLAVGLLGFIVAVVAALLAHRSGYAAGYAVGYAAGLPLILAMVIAIIYVAVRLQVWQPAIFAEDVSAIGAIHRSWRLVKGLWWRTSGILFVAAILTGVLGYILPWLVGLSLGVFGTHPTGSPGATLTLHLIQLFSQATRMVTLPLLTAISLAIYHDLKLRREGGDLLARAEALSSA